MKLFLRGGLILLLIAFQGSILNPLEIHGIKPDFILLIVYLFGTSKGEIKGGLLGMFLGFMMDVISAGPIFYNTFSKFFIGYFAGIIGRWILNPGFMLHSGLISALSLVQGAGTLLVLTFLGKGNFPSDIIYIAIPQAFFDGALGGIIYFVISYSRKETISRWT